MKYLLTICVAFIIAVQDCSAQCDAGWYAIEGSCFYFDGAAKVPYQEGRNICASLKVGADLAKVLDANTHRGIYNYIQQFGLSGSFWLGGSDSAFEGDWKWVDETRIEMGTPYWALNNGLLSWEQEPLGGAAENCLLLDSSRWWYMDDQNCFNNNHPLCMY